MKTKKIKRMVKNLFTAIIVIALLSSCSALKPLNFTSNKQIASVNTASGESKFIDDISVTPEVDAPKTEIRTIATKEKSSSKSNAALKPLSQSKKIEPVTAGPASRVETASPVQLKYAVLLNTEVESLPLKSLLDAVDEWYGVRYRKGGSTKSGIDCSAFTLAVYASAFGMSIPRVSRDQYRVSRKISTTELQEGDLVFFNTTGRGVSHVGLYLGNNKFAHASVSHGVMVSDLFDPYYLKRFVGAGRINEAALVVTP